MSSRNITDTSSRLKESLVNLSQEVIDNQNIGEQIETAITDSMICTGVMTKFYPALNKCEVKLDTTGERVLCKNSLLFMGDLLLLYTPSGDATYCENLHEPCVIPRGRLGCIVAQLNSGDDDYLFLSYYAQDEFIGLNPSKQGNMKILALNGVTESSLKFGIDGLNIVSNGEIDTTVLDAWGGEVEPKEYYSKDEIDELFDELRKEGLRPYIDNIYPVGSVYISVDETNPSEFIGGVWVQLEDTFLYATSTTADANSTTATDGSATNTHYHWQTMGADDNYVYANLSKEGVIQTKVESHDRLIITKDNKSTDPMRLDATYMETINIMPPYMRVFMWKRIE